MIELPRAAVCADEIAAHADFFSFGTNDLTQTTLGLSRDDAEGKFLAAYVEDGVIPANPFQTLDVDGVGALVQMGSEKGRAARPGLKLGICGEHGGDPASVRFFHGVGVDYVSCSPFRVPIARLAGGPGGAGGRTARSVGPPVAAPARGCEHGSVEKPSQAVELRRLADQHAALHRVAALVARSDVGADRIVAVATEEVGRLLGAEHATMVALRRRRRGGDHRRLERRRRRLRSRSGCPCSWTTAPRWRRSGTPVSRRGWTTTGRSEGRRCSYLRRTLGLRAAVAAPVVLRGRLWGAVSAATVRPEPFPPGTEQRLAAFAALLAQAVANSEAARELAASRQRLVEAGDAERRRIERNLHDGAQQRLVTLSLSLALLERQARMGTPPSAADLAGVRAAARPARWRSCASWPAASIPRCSPTTACAPPCRRSPRARRCAWTWTPTSSAFRSPSRSPPTSSRPRRSPTPRSTAAPRASRSWRGASTATCTSRSATTASAAPRSGPAPAPACGGSPTGWRRSAAGSTCAAGPARARASTCTCPLPGAPRQSDGGAGRGSVINRDPRPRVTKLQAQRRSTSTRLWKPTR